MVHSVYAFFKYVICSQTSRFQVHFVHFIGLVVVGD